VTSGISSEGDSGEKKERARAWNMLISSRNHSSLPWHQVLPRRELGDESY